MEITTTIAIKRTTIHKVSAAYKLYHEVTSKTYHQEPTNQSCAYRFDALVLRRPICTPSLEMQ